MGCERVIQVNEKGDHFYYASTSVRISRVCWCCDSLGFSLSCVPDVVTVVTVPS